MYPTSFKGYPARTVLQAAALSCTALHLGTNQKRTLEYSWMYPNQFQPGDRLSVEKAVLWCTKWWLEQSESEQIQILSDLVGEIIITEVKPERPSHAHFLAAMVAQFVNCGKL